MTRTERIEAALPRNPITVVESLWLHEQANGLNLCIQNHDGHVYSESPHAGLSSSIPRQIEQGGTEGGHQEEGVPMSRAAKPKANETGFVVIHPSFARKPGVELAFPTRALAQKMLRACRRNVDCKESYIAEFVAMDGWPGGNSLTLQRVAPVLPKKVKL